MSDALSTTFAALADPTRRAILARLAEGSATVKELSEPFDVSGPAISKHLRVLERAGLITQGRRAQWRPCQLEAAPLREVAEWTESYRRFWEASFDRLGDYLDELQGRAPKKSAADPAGLVEKVSGSTRKAGAPEAKSAKSAARSPSKRAPKPAKGVVRSASKRETEAAKGAARSASRRETEEAKTAARSPSKRQPKPVKGTARKLDERAPRAPSRTTRTRSR